QVETYLKNDDALEEFLQNIIMDDSELQLASGTLKGMELKKKVEEAARIEALMNALTRRAPMAMVEAAALSNLFGGGKLEGFVKVLNFLSPGIDPWKAEKTDMGITVARTVRSVVEHVLLDEKWLTSREAKELAGYHAMLKEDFAQPVKFI